MQPAASERSVISPCGSGILSSIALAPISFRVTERESHLLHQRSTLNSRVYECGFEGTVVVADQLLHLSRSSMMRRSWAFSPLLGIYLFVFFGLTYVNGSENVNLY